MWVYDGQQLSSLSIQPFKEINWYSSFATTGRNIYILSASSTEISLVELDPWSATYERKSPPPYYTQNSIAVAFNNTVYAFQSDGRVLAYDLTTDSWSFKKSMPSSLSRNSCGSVIQSLQTIILVGDGNQRNLCLQFNPSQDSWRQCISLLDSGTSTSRAGVSYRNDFVVLTTIQFSYNEKNLDHYYVNWN